MNEVYGDGDVRVLRVMFGLLCLGKMGLLTICHLIIE